MLSLPDTDLDLPGGKSIKVCVDSGKALVRIGSGAYVFVVRPGSGKYN